MGRYEVTVARTERLSPHMVRVTFGGESLRCFRDDGPDQRFKLLLPRPGQDAPLLPDPENWYQAWQEMPADTRPVLRTYTVRQARPGLAELDVDFVLHEPAGPASQWAARARPGDRVAIHGAWAEYEVPPGVARQLVAGDHTALPAIAAICEQLPDGAAAEVVVEVPTEDDVLRVRTPAGVDVTWVTAEPGAPGAALVRTVTELAPEQPWDYAWVAAERAAVAELRRHLVTERGLATGRVMFMGYWRRDGAIDG